MPLSALSVLECAAVGPLQFFAPGIPFALLTAVPQLYRYYIREPDVEEIVNYPNPDCEIVMTRGTQAAMIGISALLFLIEVPLQTFSTLQRLHVIGPTKWTPLSSFIPFTAMSPIWLPSSPQQLNVSTVCGYLLACARTPICLSIVRDYFSIQIGFRTYALLRQVWSKTDRSDRNSASVADEIDVIDETSIPCIGFLPLEDAARRNYGPRSFFGAFRQAFPLPYAIINFLSGGKLSLSRGRLEPGMENQLRIQVRASYRSRQRTAHEWPVIGSSDELKLRKQILERTFEDVNLYPDEELVDAEAWASAALGDMDELNSTDTPKTRDLFGIDEIMLEPFDSERADQQDAGPSRPDERFTATLTTDTSLIDHGIVDSLPSSLRDEAILDSRQGNGLTHFESDLEGSGQRSAVAVDLSADSDDAAILVVDIERLQTDPRYLDDIFEDQMSRLEQENVQEHEGTPSTQNFRPTDDSATVMNDTAQEVDTASTDPSTPTQGISRATSLIEARRRPSRRLTDTGPAPDESLVAFTDPLSSRPPRHRARLDDYGRSLSPVRRREHRMTFLSTFAVDSLAWHASAIITNLLLLPLEAVYCRSLVNWVMTASSSDAGFAWHLERSPLWTVMNTGLGDRMRVFRSSEWFGGGGSGMQTMNGTPLAGSRMQYVGALMLTLGLEALFRGTVWYIGTRVAIKRGVRFGWGKF